MWSQRVRYIVPYLAVWFAVFNPEKAKIKKKKIVQVSNSVISRPTCRSAAFIYLFFLHWIHFAKAQTIIWLNLQQKKQGGGGIFPQIFCVTKHSVQVFLQRKTFYPKSEILHQKLMHLPYYTVKKLYLNKCWLCHSLSRFFTVRLWEAKNWTLRVTNIKNRDF